jgi:hypothetical protein
MWLVCLFDLILIVIWFLFMFICMEMRLECLKSKGMLISFFLL